MERCVTDNIKTIAWCGMVMLACTSCGVLQTEHEPLPGPDRQAEGTVEGAMAGAGAGAVTGFQVGAGTGPGALVGAGLGAVAGGIQGAFQDRADDRLLKLSAASQRERERAYAQEVLQDQLKRRLELHPTREIYPADIFFRGDETRLRAEAYPILKELARLNKDRLPWSRLVVAVYVKSNDLESTYAEHLAEHRSREICDALVRAGIEPRRLETRSVLVKEPVVRDPHDRPDRYAQAVELIPADR